MVFLYVYISYIFLYCILYNIFIIIEIKFNYLKINQKNQKLFVEYLYIITDQINL